MRIAFSGAHRVGKSTLLARVAEHLTGHATVDEPFHLMEEDGLELGVGVEDFVAQLERSIEALDEEGGADVLFDRCPADLLAYLQVHEDAEAFDLAEVEERVRAAMRSLDLVVLVPIEARDRIALPSSEDLGWRQAVHEALEEILEGDALGLDLEVLRVEGDVDARARQVVARTRQ